MIHFESQHYHTVFPVSSAMIGACKPGQAISDRCFTLPVLLAIIERIGTKSDVIFLSGIKSLVMSKIVEVTCGG